MTSFTFEPEPRPFPRWMGPFCPRRGKHSGFRVVDGRLGASVTTEWGRQFWPVVENRGVRELTNLVRKNWGGGRILLLANGYVVKPLQGDTEVGQRALIGRFHGPVMLERNGLPVFDLSHPDSTTPGGAWSGPAMTGLECVIKPDGSLWCTWYHPSQFGRDEVCVDLHPADNVLASGFRAARPGDTSGRVRVTANGHVITNQEEPDGTWSSYYVGQVDAGSWPFQDHWIGGWDG